MSLLQRKFGENSSDVPASDTLPAPRLRVGQRVRVGLTGLAAIFLLVLVAAAGLRPSVSMATPQAADEPLAVLGVAPGAGPALLAPQPPSPMRPART